MLLEIAVFNIQSAIMAADTGADRLELCENYNEGGTTPSYGFLKLVREKISIPVFPIIRPRGGDFLYNGDEFEVMLKDILLCKELGFEGAVTGILKADGAIDVERSKKLADAAYPLELTFHRAFDRCNEPFAAVEQIIRSGFKRILTSGQKPTATEGAGLIRQLVQQAGDKIIIMPGSGVRSSTINELKNITQAKEFHSSALKKIPSSMLYNNISMNEKNEYAIADEEEIKKMKGLL